ALQIVCPPVVWAHEPSTAISTSFRDDHATVRAYGGEDSNLGVVVPEHDQRIIRDIDSQVITRGWDLLEAAQAQPLGAEYRRELELKELPRCVALLRQRHRL